MGETNSIEESIFPNSNFLMSHQHNFVDDLTHVEILLHKVLALLRQSQTKLQVIALADQARPTIGIYNPMGGETMETSLEFTSQLYRLLLANPQQREQTYLVRFVLHYFFSLWKSTSLVDGSMFHLDLPFRLTDINDPGISPAGTKFTNLHEALVEMDKPHLVVLGEPGAGKTTTLKQLGLDLARKRIQDPLRGKVPIWVDLFKYANSNIPSDFLFTQARHIGLEDSYDELIANGQVAFLLDGINQMPFRDRIEGIDRWMHWANSCSDLPEGNFAVFSCRNADYTSNLRLPEVHIQAIGRESRQHYFELRFGREQSARHWRDFKHLLVSPDKHVNRLVSNPLMLSLIVDNIADGQGLMKNFAQLIEQLAKRWIDYELQKDCHTDLVNTMTIVLQTLSHLAFTMQARGEGSVLTKNEVHEIQFPDRQDKQLTLEEVLTLAINARILQPTTIHRHQEDDTQGIVFCHHLLQEYFAARYFLQLFRSGKSIRQFVHTPWRESEFGQEPLEDGERMSPPPTTNWDETVIMAASLLGKDVLPFVTAVARENLPLAGRCMAAVSGELYGQSDFQENANDLRWQLMRRQRNPQAHIRARMGAGLALGEMGHPELTPQSYDFEGRKAIAILPPLQAVPAGTFLYGSDPQNQDAYPDETTLAREMYLPDFSIGRYPVTNAEYSRFINDGGYEEDRWWSEEGKHWKQGGPEAHADTAQGWLDFRRYLQQQDLLQFAKDWSWPSWTLSYWQPVVELSDDEAPAFLQRQLRRPFDQPVFWDDPDATNPARPIVGINWHEALAYCNWLSAITNQQFRLPTEFEREKAARGSDGRKFPWGEEFSSRKCNSLESQLFVSSPVGMYPEGRSPYGMEDVSGNIWEWTSSWYQAYPRSQAESEHFGERYRVARGGSWYYYWRDQRCSSRGWYIPGFFPYGIGFRILSEAK